MAHLTTMATIGGLALAGAALGIHLGNASISEINPIHFQEPATRFHSDLSPYRSPSAGSYEARADMGSPLELGTGCVGCRTYPEEYHPARDPALDRAVEGNWEEPATVELAVAEAPADADLMRRQADLDRLQRYASYAVSADQATEEEASPATGMSAAADTEASAIQGDEIASTD